MPFHPDPDAIRKASERLEARRQLVVPSPQSEGELSEMDADARDIEPYLYDLMQRCVHRPDLFVQEVWAWGKPGTILASFPQPLEWQMQCLEDMAEQLARDDSVCKVFITSGRGVGKTALLAQLYIWHVVCHRHSQTIMSAASGRQIADRPWREMRKWLRMSTVAPYFQANTVMLRHRAIDIWQGVNLTANPENPEAFQGFHEQYLAFIFDECSGMPDAILDAAESGLTDQHTLLVWASNPTRNRGYFAERCEELPRPAHTLRYTIDARDVPIVNQTRLDELIARVGGDLEHTRVRIHIRGLFSLSGHDQFIEDWEVEAAQQRIALVNPDVPITIGVDVARFGSNVTVFCIRQGAHILDIQRYSRQSLPTTEAALKHCIETYSRQYRSVRVFIDACGMGVGVYDHLKDEGYPVYEVVSSAASTYREYANLRGHLWHCVKDWLQHEGVLSPAHSVLAEQLTNMTYFYRADGKCLLESKEELQSRNLPSPDEADALAYSFFERTNAAKRAHAW